MMKQNNLVLMGASLFFNMKRLSDKETVIISCFVR